MLTSCSYLAVDSPHWSCVQLGDSATRFQPTAEAQVSCLPPPQAPQQGFLY